MTQDMNVTCILTVVLSKDTSEVLCTGIKCFPPAKLFQFNWLWAFTSNMNDNSNMFCPQEPKLQLAVLDISPTVSKYQSKNGRR